MILDQLTGSGSLNQRSVPKRWNREYSWKLKFTDSLVIVIATFVAQLARFGVDDNLLIVGKTSIAYTGVSIAISIMWILALNVVQATDTRHIGEGSQEFIRVVNATLMFFGLLAIVSVAFQLEIARGYLAIALPLGTVGLLLSRRMWRLHISQRQLVGQYRRRVVVVGGTTLPELLSTIGGQKNHSWEIVAICRCGLDDPVKQNQIDMDGIPTGVGWATVRRLVIDTGADTVAVSGTDSMGHSGMRELSWNLEDLDVDLLVAPGVLDVAGPRMFMRPVAGLPLLHVDRPRYEGANKFGKQVFDKLGALFLVTFFSPIFLICGILIRLSDGGPIFYSAERMGINSRPFNMIKFRTMTVGADLQRRGLMASNEVEGGVLFKIKNDPRVTKAGKILRRYSLDELPQLLNVLRGDMSLVGPRPPLREETERYNGLISRRMLVRPGMTGLWQVSGRSNLSWDESVRLDLTYVENWSFYTDIHILFQTLQAVLRRDGAY